MDDFEKKKEGDTDADENKTETKDERAEFEEAPSRSGWECRSLTRWRSISEVYGLPEHASGRLRRWLSGVLCGSETVHY